MRTYFLHGKITPTAFHLYVTMLKSPPTGYYYIGELLALSKHQAIRTVVEFNRLQPPHGKEVLLNSEPEIQSTYIK